MKSRQLGQFIVGANKPVSAVHLNPDKTSSNAAAVEENVLLKKSA